jgi:hypothetical protein
MNTIIIIAVKLKKKSLNKSFSDPWEKHRNGRKILGKAAP